MSTQSLLVVALATLIAAPLSAQSVLYQQPSTFADPAGIIVDDSEGWIYSENYIEALDGNDGYLADDFTIEETQSWSIDEIAVLSYYLAGSGTFEKATSFNIIVWDHDAVAGTPGSTELLRADEVTPTSDGTGANGVTGIITFALDTPLVLQSGTYWLTVQANMPTADIEQGTHYYWGSNSGTFGEPLQWWNYGGILSGADPCHLGWADNAPECRSPEGNADDPSVYFRLTGSQLVASEDVAQAQTVSILPTQPNPARASTLIPFTVREPSDVRLSIFDTLGREVAVVAERAYGVGEHAEAFDTSDLAPGTYVVRLVAGTDVVLRTMSIVR